MKQDTNCVNKVNYQKLIYTPHSHIFSIIIMQLFQSK